MAGFNLLGSLSYTPVDGSGQPYAGALLYVFRAGTTTPTASYTTSALSVSNTHPVVADGNGRFANVWVDDETDYDYRVRITTSTGSLLGDFDNIPRTNLTASKIGQAFYPQTVSELAAGVTPTNFLIRPGNVLRYGAVGDGTTDDLVALNACARVAANGGEEIYFPEGYTFGITGWLTVRNGTRRLHGRGKIKCLSNGNTAPSGVLLTGKAQGETADVSFCRVEGLYIDRNGQWSAGVYLSNSDNCQVVGCTIVNGTSQNAADYAGIYLPSFATSSTGAHDNLIANNYVEGDETTGAIGGADGIAVSGTSAFASGYTNITDQWKGSFTTPTTVNAAYNNHITGNVIIGGYYGVSLVESRYCTVVGNEIYSNIRNISLQSNCIANLIEGNSCRESNSSAIYLGFGASDNAVKSNKVYSTRAQGEGLLQAYIGCARNVFEGNHTYTTGLSPTYHIYAGIHGSGDVFKNNYVGGTCSKAYIAVESAWDNGVANNAHRVFGSVDASTEDYANAATTDLVIEGNVVAGSSGVPAMFFSQVNSDATACGLTGLRVIGNTVIGNGYSKQLELYEDNSGSLSGLILRGNSFDPASETTRFTFPRGRLHFSVADGNTQLNVMPSATPFRSFGDADTTPSVAMADYWQCANTGATSITNFDSGVDGQEITVRADTNTTFVHGSGTIKLNGATNATSLTADNILKFKRIGGVWFETGRNF